MTPFIKTGPPDQIRAEVAGWQAVCHHLIVPHMLGEQRRGDQYSVSYEDVFASRRCHHLLGDSIALADYGITGTAEVRELVHAVCDDLLRCLARTGRRTALSDCVPALYLDRLRPGGRLETWYPPTARLVIADTTRTLGELARTDLVVDGQPCRIDLSALIHQARTALAPRSRWITALTQGDPTEPNIGAPLMWLDFEHAGRNTLAGDVANLLWYLLGMGGWLVPTYQPGIYQRTLRHRLAPIVVPQLSRLHIEYRQVHVDLRWNVGAGRAAALHALREALSGDLGTACADDHPNLTEVLRPFLICRILGVIDLRQLNDTDCILVLARLAQLLQPAMNIDKLLDAVIVHTSDTAHAATTHLHRRPPPNSGRLVASDDSRSPHTEGPQ